MKYQIEFTDKEIILAFNIVRAIDNENSFVECDVELAKIIRGNQNELFVNQNGYHWMPRVIATYYLADKLATAINGTN